MILLISDTLQAPGESACAAGTVAGERVAERRYSLEGHFLAVDGAGFHEVARHDAEQLIAGGHWRLASASEQNQYAAMKKKAGSLNEGKKG